MEFKHNEKSELNNTGVSHVQPVATMTNLLTSSMATSYNNEIYGMTSLYSVATACDSNIMQYDAVALGNYSTTIRHEMTFLKKWLTTISLCNIVYTISLSSWYNSEIYEIAFSGNSFDSIIM